MQLCIKSNLVYYQLMNNPTQMKEYAGNKIRELMKTKSLQSGDSVEQIEERLKKRLNISNRLSAILNNTFPPSIHELVHITDELDCTIDEVIITREL